MRRHAFDPVSFTFGALFLAVAAAGLTGPWVLRDLDLAWLGPAAVVFLGLVVLLTALSPRAAHRPDPDPAPEQVAGDEEPAGEDDGEDDGQDDGPVGPGDPR